jgi:putative endonuclease
LWIVVHLEFFQNKTEALKREKWFKSGAGRDFIKEIKKQGFLSAAAD